MPDADGNISDEAAGQWIADLEAWGDQEAGILKAIAKALP